MKRFLPVILLFCAAALPAPLRAQAPSPEPVLNPYEGRVPVADQSAGARDEALRAALGQVLQRIGGDPPPPGTEALAGRAAQLVQRYGYEVDPVTRQLQFVAAFDARAVDAQLRALGGSATAPEEELRMTVSGIGDARDYARVVQALKGLPGVSRVQVTAASGSLLDLRLRVQGGVGRVSGALFAGGLLTPETPAPGVELAYRLR